MLLFSPTYSFPAGETVQYRVKGGEKVVEKRKDESTPLQHDYLPYVQSRKKKGRRKKTLQHHPQYLHHSSQPAAKLDIRAGTTVPKASALRLIAAFCAKQTHLRN